MRGDGREEHPTGEKCGVLWESKAAETFSGGS